MSTDIETLTSWRSGQLNGDVHSRNAHGQYIRPYVVPADPNTVRQQRVRNRLGAVSAAWGTTLTQRQRDGWIQYATRVRFQFRGPDPIHLSGQQLFIRNNAGRTRPFMGIVLDAPTVGNSGVVVTPSFTDLLGIGQVTTNFDTADEWVTQDGAFLVVYASPARPITHQFYGGQYRFVTGIPGNSVTPPTSPVTVADPFAPAGIGNRWAQHRVAYGDGRLTHAIQTRFTGL